MPEAISNLNEYRFLSDIGVKSRQENKENKPECRVFYGGKKFPADKKRLIRTEQVRSGQKRAFADQTKIQRKKIGFYGQNRFFKAPQFDTDGPRDQENWNIRKLAARKKILRKKIEKADEKTIK